MRFFISYEEALKSVSFLGDDILDGYYSYKGVDYYVVSTNAKIKVETGFDVTWDDAVVYTNDSNILFTRSAEEFYGKFKKIRDKRDANEKM
ncbi:MAG: hypothetical protein U9Q40_11585 [Campylobacterota bacterium]|nr:hypothetical protein [Campylobacterota bacterium]